MSSKQVLWGLVPWLLYAVVTIPDDDRAAEVAALVALAWALGAAARDLYQRRSVKIVDACAIAIFGGYAILGAWGSQSTASTIEDQGRGLAAAVLAAVMLVSAAISPFTEQYARESVPPVYWTSPVFRSIHRDLSIRWGVAIVFVAISYLVAEDVHAVQGSNLVTFALTWILPLIAIVVAVRSTTTSTAPEGSRKLFRSGTP